MVLFGLLLLDRAAGRWLHLDLLPDFPYVLVVAGTPLLHWAWHMRHDWKDFPDVATPGAGARVLAAFLFTIPGIPLLVWIATDPLCSLAPLQNACGPIQEALMAAAGAAVIAGSRRLVRALLPP